MRHFLPLLYTCILFCFSPTSFSIEDKVNEKHNDEWLSFSGKIINEFNTPLSKVEVSVAGVKGVTNQQGKYTFNVPFSATYQLKFSKKGYFNSIQSFSHEELRATNKTQNTIADIALVAQVDNRVMLAFGGDVMMGRRYYAPHFNQDAVIDKQNKLAGSKAVVQHIKPYMSIADYAAVNLESQVAAEKPKQRAPKSVTFYSYPEILEALSWAGIDYVSLGNNHTFDYMHQGLTSTLGLLQQSDLGFSGAGFTEKEALQAHHQKIKNTEFSMLGYVGWEGRVTPTQTANNEHGGAAYGSMENINRTVQQAVQESKIPIVQYHGSQEYANNPTGVTEQRLKSAIDKGAALAIAHHPHVTQGLELYDNKLIAYSMGNLIFDQNFSATQHSFLLYVWLDNGKFHRAEIVPLYVKGYQPAPATGINRFKVMKRLIALSKQRNTLITRSGGHGIIQASTEKAVSTPVQKETLLLGKNEKVTQLHKLPWHKQLNKIHLPDAQIKYRLGTNLINASDFESFHYFDSHEQGWLFDPTIATLKKDTTSASQSLALALKANIPSLFGMKYFRRVYQASNPMTIKAKFKNETNVIARFYWQGRKRGQKLLTALQSSEKHLIKTVKLLANSGQQGQWKNVEVEFNSPRSGYRSYRVLVEFETVTGSQLEIDDFSLIEWQSAYSNNPKPAMFNLNSKQAEFIGVEHLVNDPIMLHMQ